jgi:pectate lyase
MQKLMGLVALVFFGLGIVCPPPSARGAALVIMSGASNSAPDFNLIGWATVNGNTTGGAGAGTGTVSTAKAFTSAVQSSASSNILVSGTIDLGGSTVNIRSRKTIVGLGSNATIIGHVAFNGPGISNVILRNLTLMNPAAGADALTIQDNTHHVWVDHCHFAEAGDGELDITHGSDYITVSWCKFSYTNTASAHRFSSLVGHNDGNGAEDSGHLKVTYHHNWWSAKAQERMPRVRFGQIHLFNNYYNSVGNNYCIGVGCSCQILLESCYFDTVSNPWKNYSGTCAQGLIHWNDDNVFVNATQPTWASNSTVFVPPYSYSLDAGNNVATIVTNYCGVGKGPFAP